MLLEGKAGIITGAGSGIGEAYALAVAREGAAVAVADIDGERARRVADAITATGGRAVAVEVDVARADSTQAMAERAVRELGGIDFLVNNAAIYRDMKIDSLLTVDWDYYAHFMDVNMNGALHCVRACWKFMRDRGGGSIVNQSSTAAWMAAGFYGIAKLALNGITQSLARELGPMNIRVNAIAPGPIDTEATRRVVPREYLDQLVRTLPLSRIGTPQDLEGALLFLLSDASRWVTGHVLNVDGGQIMRP